MANCCVNYVVFTGGEDNRKKLLDFLFGIIDNADGVHSDYGSSFYNAYIDDNGLNDDSFMWEGDFTCESHWLCPITLLVGIARQFKVDFSVDYEELGSSEYGQYQYNYEKHELIRFALDPKIINSIEEDEDECFSYNGKDYDCKYTLFDELLDELTLTENYEHISI